MLDGNMFFQNPDTREIIDAVVEERLFRSPFKKPESLPVQVHLVNKDDDLTIYRDSGAPHSQIHGRCWSNLSGTASVPVECTRVIENSRMAFRDLSIKTSEMYRFLEPHLLSLANELSLDFKFLELFWQSGLRGRYFLGCRIEFLYELYYQVILASGIPCGWIGTFPDEMTVGLYPLDCTLVVFSPNPVSSTN